MNDPKAKIKQQETELENEELRTEDEEVTDEVEVLQEQLAVAEEKCKRAVADYHNLEYQARIERMQYVKLANRNLIEALLEPLDFMETATKHINDKGLQMVIQRFHQVLQQEGLEEITVKIGDEFNEKTMEVIDTVEGDIGKVMEVRQKGFTLNGEVIRHARVVVGKTKN